MVIGVEGLAYISLLVLHHESMHQGPSLLLGESGSARVNFAPAMLLLGS